VRQSTRQSVLFSESFQKPLAAVFDAASQTSDAGLILLGTLDRRLDVTRRLCAHLPDARQAGKVEHGLLDLVRQRVYSIAAGYADGNDAQHLRHDPALKVLCDRDPIQGPALASQPTLSRFENSVPRRALVRAARAFEAERIERFARRFPDARCVVIDLDATVDPTHGQQTFSFFNAFYDTHCFLPLLGFLSVEGTTDQFLFSTRLRPGVGASGRGVIPLLRRTVGALRELLPHARVLVRLDAGFAGGYLLEVLDELGVDYVVAVASNSVLNRRSKRFLRGLRCAVRASGSSARRYGALRYQARSWNRARRVVVKAEVLPPPPSAPKRKIKTNLRFVVTNRHTRPRSLYESTYCARGDTENRIKELKQDLEMDRTSCSDFGANQLRVLMTATAYALYQEMRWALRSSDLARAQVNTLRLSLIKIGARVVSSVRRLVFHLPLACPNAALWCRLARTLGAVPG
jgi:hypothetical protein